MCLLIAYARIVKGAPLILAGNRDELLARPARAMDLLSAAPRILGGRDLVARGTWMAVGAHGVVAALTNRPPQDGVRTVAPRSRGELPLLAAAQPTARAGAEALARIDPAEFNPGWLLVADRWAIFYVEVLTGAPPAPVELPPGLHILENRPLDAPSPKVAHVRALLADAPVLGRGLLHALEGVLANRELPPSLRRTSRAWPPIEVEAASVRTPTYGTRWSGLVTLGEDRLPPRFLFSDGPAGEARFQRARVF